MVVKKRCRPNTSITSFLLTGRQEITNVLLPSNHKSVQRRKLTKLKFSGGGFEAAPPGGDQKDPSLLFQLLNSRRRGFDAISSPVGDLLPISVHSMCL